jgi:hypothetical protein
MPKRRHSFRSLIFAATLAVTSVFITVATAFADGAAGPFPK